MLPIRGQACYREGATATVSVYDRRGRRLGTVYLGRMPEPAGDLVRATDRLDRGGVAELERAGTRLVYITDGGTHQAGYYRRVLRRMDDCKSDFCAAYCQDGRLSSCSQRIRNSIVLRNFR